MSPLQVAINNQQNIIFKLLLLQEFQSQSDKIDVNKRSMKAIIGEEIEVFERTSLYMSIEKKNIDVIKALLAREEIDVNEKSFHLSGNTLMDEKTALHLAVEIGDLGIIKLLLEKKGIDINIEDSQGRKPIDYSSDDEVRQLFSH